MKRGLPPWAVVVFIVFVAMVMGTLWNLGLEGVVVAGIVAMILEGSRHGRG